MKSTSLDEQQRPAAGGFRLRLFGTLGLVLLLCAGVATIAAGGKKKGSGKAKKKPAEPAATSVKLIEASAVAKTGDKFALFSDERPGVYLTANLADATSATVAKWKFPPANDMEAAGTDRDGSLFICTSHSVTRTKAKDESERKMFIRVDHPTSNDSRKISVNTNLRETITRAPACPEILKQSTGARPDTAEAGFNIEGIALIPEDPGNGSVLLVGFRSPLTAKASGNAIIARIDHPGKLFEKDAPAKASDIGLTFFDIPLNGLGVRDLYWDAKTQRVMIIAGAVGDDTLEPTIYTLSNPLEPARRRVSLLRRLPMQLPGYVDAFHPEAIIRDGNGFVVLSDNKQPPVQWYRFPDTDTNVAPGPTPPPPPLKNLPVGR